MSYDAIVRSGLWFDGRFLRAGAGQSLRRTTSELV